MAFNSTLAEATALIPEWVSSTSGTPTTAQATQIWTRVYSEILLKLAKCGFEIPLTFGTATVAEDLLQHAEALTTSGEILRAAHGAFGNSTSAQADQLMAEGSALVAEICDAANVLDDMGVTSGLPSTSQTIGETYHTEFDQVDLNPQPVTEPVFHVADEV